MRVPASRSQISVGLLLVLLALVVPALLAPGARADSATTMASFAWHTQATGAWDGSNAWLFGGCSSGSGPLSDIVKFTPGTNSVTTVSATLPQPRAYATSQYASNVNKIYIFGGEIGSTSCTGSKTATILSYVPGASSVSTLGNQLPRALQYAASVYDGSRYIYIFGGDDGTSPDTHIVRFDTTTESATTLSQTMPYDYYGGSAVWDGTSAYIVGLHNFNQPYVVKFTPGSNAAVIGSLPLPNGGSFPNYYQATTFMGGYLYVLGGVSTEDPYHVIRVTPSPFATVQMPVTLPSDGYTGSQTGFNTGGFAYYQGRTGNYVKYDPTTAAPSNAQITSPTSPFYGRANTYYSFTASASGTGSLQYGWDWNGDGTVDEWDSTTSTTHSYASDATYTVKVMAKDVLGQTSAWSSALTVTIDSVNPSSPNPQSSTHPTSTGWYSNNAPSFTWTQSDGGSGVLGSRFALDATPSGGFVSQTSKSYTSVADGTHTFYVDVSDKSGNVASASYVFKVDTTAPTAATPAITSGTTGSNGWYTTNVGFAINSADALTTSPCEQHSTASTGPWDGQACNTADSWTDATEGSRTWYGYARDLAANTRAGADSQGVKIDKTAPTITDNQADVSWTSTNPSLDVDFGDATSGISNVEYRVWSGAGQSGTMLKDWTSVFSTSADGTGSYTQNWQADSTIFQQGNNYVSVRVTDRAGWQTSANDVARVQWDNAAPSQATPTVTGGTFGQNGWYTTDVGMSIDAADATSGVATRWHSSVGSSGPWSGGGATDAWTDSTEGTVTWYGRAIDNAGNAFVSGGVPIKLDKTAPTSTLTPSGTLGSNGWYTTNVQETLGGSDATSGPASLHYKVDSGSWNVYPGSSTTFSVTGDGTHTVSYYTVDSAGNADGSDAAPHTATVRINTAVPSSTATITSGTLGQNNWYTTQVSVTISASDATSGVQSISYSVDGGAWTNTATNPVTVNVATAGAHTVSYYATNNAGSSDGSQSSPHTLSFQVDRAAPVSTISVQGTTGQNGWLTTPASVTIGATDDASGVASTSYGVNDASTPLAYTGAFSVSQQGTVTVYAASRDNAGLAESPAVSRVVKIDTDAPGFSSWTQSPPDVSAAYSGPVSVSVAIDGGPSGVSAASLQWSYDGGSTWSAAALTHGAGNVWNGAIPEPANGWWFYKTQDLVYQVQATDGAGNAVTTSAITDTIDRVAPTTTILSPASYAQWGNGTRAIQYTGQDADHDAVTYRVWLSSDNGATFPTLLCTNTVTENGATNAYSCNLDTSQRSDSYTYAFQVTATDGLFNAQYVVHDVTIENHKPTVSLVNPEEGSICTLTVCVQNPLGDTRVVGIVTLQASASDPGPVSTGIAHVDFYVDGALVGSSTTPASSGYYQVSWNSLTKLGTHTIGVQAYDNAGNASPMQVRTVIVIADASL